MRNEDIEKALNTSVINKNVGIHVEDYSQTIPATFDSISYIRAL